MADENAVTVVTNQKEEAPPPASKPWHERFLTLLSETGSVTAAAKGAGIARLTAYRERHADALFAQKWEAALELGIDALEDEARARALARSDLLLIFLLKGARPEKYRDRVEQRTITITPEEARRMSAEELEAELKRRGVL